jgi:hypothetical protein
MAIGPGKYDEECTRARVATGAVGVVLIVIEGKRGSGFSVQVHDVADLQPGVLANMLRTVADELERAGGLASS